MGALEKLIDYVDANPRPVAIALLGVIAAGGVGGGLYVNALKASIEQSKSLLTERVQIDAARYGVRSEMALRRTLLLEEQVRLLRSGFEAVRSSVDSAASTAARSATAPRNARGGARPVPSGSLSSLKAKLDSVDRELAKADSLTQILGRVEAHAVQSVWVREFFSPTMLVLAALAFTVFLWRARRARRA